MDREYVVEHDVVNRYLADKLSDGDRAAFEEYFLSCPETLDELELTEKLREGLANAATAADRWRPGFVTRLLYSPQYAAAASVLLAVSLIATGGLLFEKFSDAGSGMSGNFSNQVYVLETVRGTTDDPGANLVFIGRAASPIVLIVYPEFGEYDQYRATVHPIGDEATLWLAQSIRSESDALAIILPGDLVTPGDYRVRVHGITRSDDSVLLEEISFRASAADAVR